MRTTLIGLALFLSVATLPMTKVLAQNGANCTGRCESQFGVCEASAEAALEECLDRAEGAHEKAKCAAAFIKLEDACRTTEAACLSNCPSS